MCMAEEGKVFRKAACVCLHYINQMHQCRLIAKCATLQMCLAALTSCPDLFRFLGRQRSRPRCLQRFRSLCSQRSTATRCWKPWDSYAQEPLCKVRTNLAPCMGNTVYTIASLAVQAAAPTTLLSDGHLHGPTGVPFQLWADGCRQDAHHAGQCISRGPRYHATRPGAGAPPAGLSCTEDMTGHAV
jgi:hypothetical protein